MLTDAHYEASRESPDRQQMMDYWKQPKVWADIRFAFEQFFKLHPEETGYRQTYALYASYCGQWQEFLNQVKHFASTNYAYFGGIERFNSMVRFAAGNAQKR
jgi:hypothetical protein